MKKNLLCIGLALFAFSMIHAQDSATRPNPDEAYLKKKKTAKGLIIGGGVSLGASVALGVVAMAQVTEEVFVSPWTDQNFNENAGEGAAIASTVLFIGGAAMLTAGLIINGNANRMKREGAVTINPGAPPLLLAGRSFGQHGLSLRVKLGR